MNKKELLRKLEAVTKKYYYSQEEAAQQRQEYVEECKRVIDFLGKLITAVHKNHQIRFQIYNFDTSQSKTIIFAGLYYYCCHEQSVPDDIRKEFTDLIIKSNHLVVWEL